MNWKLERNWKTIQELEEQIDIYFSNNEKVSNEMLYVHLGITKHDAYNWNNRSKNDKLKKQGALISKALDYIRSDLAHEIKNAEFMPKSQLLYMKVRFKENWEEGEQKETNNKITINFNNEGENNIG